MKRIMIILVALVSVLTLQACGRAHSNMQTITTTDCGVSWNLIKVGETVPALVGPCSYKVTVPDYPMQGDTKFKTSFKGKVLAQIDISYDYQIVDGKKFIAEAKFLGSATAGKAEGDQLSGLYESAENSVIDKRIREVASDLLIKEDIVDFDQAKFEDQLLLTANKMLEPLGIRLNFLSFVPIPEEQTRLAIDMMTAMKIYKDRGMEELGGKIAAARAGASRISVQVDPPKEAKK